MEADDTRLMAVGTSVAGTSAGNGDPPAGREIVVNGRRCAVRGDDVGFDQIVGLASADGQQSDTRSLSVTYRRGPAAAAEGILSRHQRTPLADGETFVVTRTDKS